MLQTNKFTAVIILFIAGFFFFTAPLFAHSGNRTGQCGMNGIDESNLSETQINKIDRIEDNFNKEIIPLQQKLNMLNTEEYNYTLNENVDVEKIKEFENQIREVRGKIEETRLDMVAETNKILPEDKQQQFNGYLGWFGNRMNMMNGYGMMNNMMTRYSNQYCNTGNMMMNSNGMMHNGNQMMNGSNYMNGNSHTHNMMGNRNHMGNNFNDNDNGYSGNMMH